jgi:acyl-CoA dehydrogenase
VSQPAADSASLIRDAVARILRDVADPQTLNRAKDDGWRRPAWSALEEAGLTLAWVPEALGGAGAELGDGFAVLREAGRFALPLPLAETLLAGWLLSRVGIAAPKGAMACAPARPEDVATVSGNGTLSGRLRAVPMAKEAAHLTVFARRGSGSHAVALIDAKAASIADGASMAGDALNAVTLKDVRPLELKDAADLDGDGLLLMGAAARAMQMAGALEAALDLTVAYANERVAFERPIAKFQAVQHNLARLAGEVAAAVAAAGSAADAIASAGFPPPLTPPRKPSGSPRERGAHSQPEGKGEGNPGGARGDEAVFLEVAAAKIRVGEAATEGAAIAHQVLGAIGFTQEHTLHRFTRRLWAWRDDFGNESWWAAKLGALVAAKGPDGLWPILAAR